jgi:hypothetical protein
MSKTAQRKRALYDQGYEHGRTNHHFYWKRHPFMDVYSRGYSAGQQDRWSAAKKVRDTSGALFGPALFAGVLVAGAVLIAAVSAAA